MADTVIDCWKEKNNLSEPLVSGERFMVKLANNDAELEQALRLRFEVFKAEQGRLPDSYNSTLDYDEYDDESCLHLLVIERELRRVVGTYRVRPGVWVRAGQGFYSERQYEIRGLEAMTLDTCEVGRSCVALEYRNGSVVGLLWQGLSELRSRMRFRYLIGCASLETVDPGIGWGMYEKFRHENMLSPVVECVPRRGFELKEAIPVTDSATLRREMPPLLKGYIRMGAKIGGLPAYDPEFDSIDFLILMDFDHIPERYIKHFNLEK